jgi:FixJ family two-component response regulator
MPSPTSQKAPIVFVVDDDISVRESLEDLINAEGLETLSFASAELFLTRPRISAPSCLILDVSLPDLNGLEVQQSLLADRNEMPIIFITGQGDVATSVKAMKAGAMEFLTKPFKAETLMDAIRDAIERSRIALDNQDEMQALEARYAALSQREREVMELVVAGLLNKQAAGELGISEITVKAHRGRVMQKMNARSLPELVRISAKLGLPSRPRK